MDHIYIEKFQAMKAKNKFKKNRRFLDTLIFYCLTILTCIIFCFSPLWFPSLCSSMKNFLSISVPSFWTCIFNPKCLFIVCNVIVVFLVGESKFFGSAKSSDPATEVYQQCLERSKSSDSIQKISSIKEKMMIHQELKPESSFMEEVDVTSVVSDHVREEKVMKRQEEPHAMAQSCYPLPADEELNQRVENFIARVKKQRKLETGVLVYCN